MLRRIGILAALLAFGLVAANAQDYPSRPIKLLIHTPPGSLVDVLGRIVGQELGDRMGQSLVIDNRVGGATTIAVEQLKNSPPDGYTLMINTSETTMLPILKKSYRTDPIKDFTPIALVVTSWTVFAVNPKVPANTSSELVAYSKSHSGGVRYGSGGTGGVLYIAVEMLKLKNGGNFVHVPYRGGAQTATDAISGQIEMVSMGLASTCVAEGGQLKIVAQTGPRRYPMLPDVPTTAEGGLPDVRMDTCVRPGRAARYAKGDCRAHQQGACDDCEAARVPGQAVEVRSRGRLQAGRRVHFVHDGRHQEVARVDPGDGHSIGRVGEDMAKKTAAKKSKMLTWPNGKKVAVSVTVLFETWPDDSAPNYSVQTTHLKKGTVDHAAKVWATYGGRVGVWRLMRTFERLGVPATFFVNARCTEIYPDAVKQIAKSGFDIAAHSYTQDDLPSYFSPDEQNGLIRKSIDLLEGCAGKKVTGWGSPVVAFTPETAGLLKQNGLRWTCDVTYTDLPIKIRTPHGPIAGVPTTDFSDNRVLRASSRDLFDVHRGTFGYLRQNETIGLQTLVIHT